MRLAFKRLGFGFTEKEVEITLNLGTLEAVCKALEIKFGKMCDEIKKDNFDFSCELLYQGYITACKDRYEKSKLKYFRTPEYDRVKAILWYEHMSQSANKEFADKLSALIEELEKVEGPKKSKKITFNN